VQWAQGSVRRHARYQVDVQQVAILVEKFLIRIALGVRAGQQAGNKQRGGERPAAAAKPHCDRVFSHEGL
jgi:hypothetical protein